MTEPVPDWDKEYLDEAEPECWCETHDVEPDGTAAQYPEDYKEDHMVYIPNREGFSPFAAFVSVIMVSLVICMFISLVS